MPVFFINLIIRFSWALYRDMWDSNGEYVIDGNLKSYECTDTLHTIKTQTLIIVCDNDECVVQISEFINEKIPDSELIIYPQSGHMTFVD